MPTQIAASLFLQDIFAISYGNIEMLVVKCLDDSFAEVICVLKILFVCHGNICRSPMAEFVLKDMVRKERLQDYFEIASAATHWDEIGSPVYAPARRKLAEHGISCSGKTARLLEKADMQRYDLLIGMDSANLRNIHRICGGDPNGKVSLLLDWCGERRDVADPWYTGDFHATWDDITRGCRALLDELVYSRAYV